MKIKFFVIYSSFSASLIIFFQPLSYFTSLILIKFFSSREFFVSVPFLADSPISL